MTRRGTFRSLAGLAAGLIVVLAAPLALGVETSGIEPAPELCDRDARCADLGEADCVADPYCDPVYLQCPIREPIPNQADGGTGPGEPCEPRYDGCVGHDFAELSIDHSLFVKTAAIVDLPRYSFSSILGELAGEARPGQFVEDLLALFTVEQTIGEFTAAPQPEIQDLIDGWPRDPTDGGLDLRQAPLLATGVVNRIDLASQPGPYGGHCGEARVTFIYQPDDIFGFGQHEFPFGRMTVIAEFGVPDDGERCRRWAARWARLSELPLGSKAYADALRAITDELFLRGGLNQLRTNEFIEFAFPWELREFNLDPFIPGGSLFQVTVKQQADFSLEDDEAFLDWVRANEEAILADAYTIPAQFLAASALASGVRLNLPPPFDGEVSDILNFNACSGCHLTETGTAFVHVAERPGGTGEAPLSLFLLDDLERRLEILRDLIGCDGDARALELVEEPKSAPH